MWLFRSVFVLIIYSAINIYSGIRIFSLLKFFFPAVRALVFWPLFLVFCHSMILAFVLRLDSPPLRQAAMYSMPFLLYICMGLLLLDAARLILRFVVRHPLSPAHSAAGTAAVLGLAVLVMVFGSIHVRRIHSTRYEVRLVKAFPASASGSPAAPLRIALISDLHIGSIVNSKWLAAIVDAVNASSPDLICIAGDIFDTTMDRMRDNEGIAAELARFRAPLGVYACLGNHDVDRFSLSSLDGEAPTGRIRTFLNNSRIILLEDEVLLINNNFYLAGRRDVRPIGGRSERKTAEALLEGIENRDTSKPLFVMDHQPVDFPALDAAGVDFILSGHTHKGQFFPGNIATASIFRNAGAVDYGHWKGRIAQAVVTSGAGAWGLPFRLFTSSEVVVVNIGGQAPQTPAPLR